MLIAGIDEAGRGSLISRVYSAIVVLPENFLELCNEEKIMIRDSKKMTKLQRKKSRRFIEKYAIDYNVQFSEHWEIDKVGISRATMNSMNRCIEKLNIPIDKLYIDGDYFDNYHKDIPYECIIRGDDIVPEIACASILAKEYRDEYIRNLYLENKEELEKYGIDRNMGYGTKVHMDAISENGFTEFHRKSFCKKSFSYFMSS